MDIHLRCQWCGQDLVVDIAGSGKVLPCPGCKVELTIPKVKPVRDKKGRLSRWIVETIIGGEFVQEALFERREEIKPFTLRVNGEVRPVEQYGLEILYGLHDLFLKSHPTPGLMGLFRKNSPIPKVEIYVEPFRHWESLSEQDVERLVKAYEKEWHD